MNVECGTLWMRERGSLVQPPSTRNVYNEGLTESKMDSTTDAKSRKAVVD